MARAPSRRNAAHRVDLPREGGGGKYVGGGKTLPRRIPTSPLRGEVDAAQSAAAGEGATGRKDFVRQLRENMTETETKLWRELRAKRFENFKFRRQVPIGRYVVDFICFEHRLIVEVDGSQHNGSEHDALQAMDGTLLAIQEALKA